MPEPECTHNVLTNMNKYVLKIKSLFAHFAPSAAPNNAAGFAFFAAVEFRGGSQAEKKYIIYSASNVMARVVNVAGKKKLTRRV